MRRNQFSLRVLLLVVFLLCVTFSIIAVSWHNAQRAVFHERMARSYSDKIVDLYIVNGEEEHRQVNLKQILTPEAAASKQSYWNEFVRHERLAKEFRQATLRPWRSVDESSQTEAGDAPPPATLK